MIISHKHKLIYISTPGCGSHSMYELLETEFDGQRAFGDAGYHNREIPEPVAKWWTDEGYRIFTTVRNPLGRLTSAWTQCLHQNNRVRETWLKLVENDSLEAFARWCADNVDLLEIPDKSRPMALKATPLHVWHQNTPVDTFLHIEAIDAEFAQFINPDATRSGVLADLIPVPRLNTHQAKEGLFTITPAAAAHIKRWYGSDVDQFKYNINQTNDIESIKYGRFSIAKLEFID